MLEINAHKKKGYLITFNWLLGKSFTTKSDTPHLVANASTFTFIKVMTVR